MTRLYLTATLALLASAFAVSAQEAPKKPHVPLEKTIGERAAPRPTPSLAVINAAGAKIDGGKLILTGVSPNTIVFADRPVHAAGHEMTKQFIMQWDEGKDSFAKDPPNATVSVLGANPGEVGDAVVVLKSPKLDGTTLTFEVAVLEGNLAGASGPAALFIDAFAFRGPDGGGFAHAGGYGGYDHAGGAYWHAPAYHGAWYGRPGGSVNIVSAPVYGGGAGAVAAGAALGLGAGALAASAARPYAYPYVAPPPCGYYPYPPCY